MKTILLISPYWKEAHRWMVSSVKLAELWQRIGYRVVVVCMGSEDEVEEVSPTLTIHRRKDVYLKDPWNYGIAWGFSNYVCHVEKELKPEHIVINKLLFWSSISAIRLWIRRKRPTVITDAFVGMTWWPRGRIPKICSVLYAWSLGWLILLCSKQVVTFHPQPDWLLRLLCIRGKTRVIPTGIDTDQWSCQLSNLRQGYGRQAEVRGQKPIITYVGRLESIKGVDVFLEAAADLHNAHIQIVGRAEPNHPLVEQYNDKVKFLGLRDDISEILQSTDIFVLPSFAEGLSNALMEAMASGCACVASRVGGNRYLIEDGSSGLLFTAGDVNELRKHLEQLIADPDLRSKLMSNARKRIEEQFSWDRVGTMYQELFTPHPSPLPRGEGTLL